MKRRSYLQRGVFTFYGRQSEGSPLPGVAFTIVFWRVLMLPPLLGEPIVLTRARTRATREFTRACSLISTGESVSTSIESASVRTQTPRTRHTAPFESFIARDAIALVSPAIRIYAPSP